MRRIAASALVLSAGLAVAAGEAPPERDAVLGLPGVRVFEDAGRTLAFYGAPMTRADSAAQAATDWVNLYARAFGSPDSALALTKEWGVSNGRFTHFEFTQWMDDLPVERGVLRVLVRNAPAPLGHDDHTVHESVLASGRIAQRPAGGFAPVTVSAEEAAAAIGRIQRFASLERWTEPELVVYFGEGDFNGWIEPVKAWKFVAGDASDRANPRVFTFFVDASAGSVIHARGEVHNVDITGRVMGLTTQGAHPDTPSNPPVSQGVRGAKVTVQGSNPAAFAYTDQDGNFTISWPGAEPVTLSAGVAQGLWGNVDNAAGSEITATVSATPGTPATLDMTPAYSGPTTAQVNALTQTTVTHDHFKRYAPSYTGLDFMIPVFVNEASTCNAFYQSFDDSTHYFAPGDGCVNTAYASVVHHEYGHYIVNQRGLAQGSFGEGFADTMSILILDDPIIGHGFGGPPFFPNGWVRDPVNAPQQYPCSGGGHDCGQVLGAVTWFIREGMGTRYGSLPGLDVARQLHVDWALVTSGGLDNDAAHPLTAIEFLTVDDDDGMLCTGTPHYTEISEAFADENIASPPAETRANVRFVEAVPGVVQPGQVLTFTVTAAPGSATLTPNSGVLHFRLVGQAEFTTTPMTAVSPTQYTFSLPPIVCGQAIQFYASVGTSQGDVSAPSQSCTGQNLYSITAATSSSDTFTDFESGAPGWVSGPHSHFANPAGYWMLATPTSGGTGVPGADHSEPGTQAWITGANGDVSGTWVMLNSPTYDLSQFADASVSYWYWWYSDGANTGNTDSFLVQASNDGGGSWRDAVLLGPDNSNASWRQGGFSLSSLNLTTSSQVKFRFRAGDFGLLSLVEAGLDDFRVSALACETGPACDSVDFNGDQLFPDNQDLIDYLSVFGGGACSTGTCGDIDFNNDGLFPDNEDIAAFFRVFGGGSC